MKTPKAVKLPSGQWRCQVTISGQRVSVTRPTKKEAEKIAAEIKLGTERIPKPVTLRDAYAQYIESKRGVLHRRPSQATAGCRAIIFSR